MSTSPAIYDDFVRLDFDSSGTVLATDCDCQSDTMRPSCCPHAHAVSKPWKHSSGSRKRSSVPTTTGNGSRRISEQYLYSSMNQRSESEESLSSNLATFTFVSSSIEPPEETLTVILPSGGVESLPFGPETTFGEIKHLLWNRKHPPKPSPGLSRRSSFPKTSSVPKLRKPKVRNRSRSWSVLDSLPVSSSSSTSSPSGSPSGSPRKHPMFSFTSGQPTDYVFVSPLAGRIGSFLSDDSLVIQVQLLDNIVKLVEVGQSRREEALDQFIGIVIDKPVSKLDSYASEEVRGYRIALHNCMYRTVMDRESRSIEDRIAYEFPVDLDDADKMELSSFFLKTPGPDAIPISVSGGASKVVSASRRPEVLLEDAVYADVLLGSSSQSSSTSSSDYSSPLSRFAKGLKNRNRKHSIPDYNNEVDEMMRNCGCEGQTHWSWKRMRNVPNRCAKCLATSGSRQVAPVVNGTEEYADHYEVSLSTSHYSFVRAEGGFQPKSARFTAWISFEIIFGTSFLFSLPHSIIEMLGEFATDFNPLDNLPPKRSKSFAQPLLSLLPTSGSLTLDRKSETGSLARSKSMKKRFGRIFRRKSSPGSQKALDENDNSTDEPEVYDSDEEEIPEVDDKMENLRRMLPFELRIRVDNERPSDLVEKVLKLFKKTLKFKLSHRLGDKAFDPFIDKVLEIESMSRSTLDNGQLGAISAKDSRVGKLLEIMQNFKLDKDRFVLQICGYDQYLVAEYPLLTFEYIRDTVSKQLPPQVLLVPKAQVIESLTTYNYISPVFIQKSSGCLPIERGFFSTKLELIMEQIRNQENALLTDVLSKGQIRDSFLLEDNSRSFQDLLEQFQASLANPKLNPMILPRAKDSLGTQESNYATICHQDGTERTTTKALPVSNSESIDPLNMDDYLEKEFQDQDVCSSWKMGTILRFKVLLATYINISGVDQVFVQAGVYHGDTLISDRLSTRMTDSFNLKWHQLLEFQQMLVSDIPLSAKLCLTIVAYSQKGKSDASYCPVAYANLPFFDYKRRMLSDRIQIQMWPINVFEDVNEEQNFLNPSGELGINPDKVSASKLQIEFENFSNMIIFPLSSEIKRYAEANLKRRQAIVNKRQTKEHEELLQELLACLDPFWEPSVTQKEFIWEKRYHLRRTAPESLPKLVQSVSWFHREAACEFYVMLEDWPVVSLDTALSLLQIKYSDPIVREFAVRSLDVKLTDGLMMHYMLQLIQSLRNEPYHDTPLARFLLKRSLSSRKLGQMMFWTLKSQLSDSSVCLRFSVLLEMYCRGLSDKALEETVRQLNAFEKFALVLQETENETTGRREKIVAKLMDEKVIHGLHSPMNITLPLDGLIYDKCRLMDSAKKPLWLEWHNGKQLAWANRIEKNAIIFKTGDDIRQDMLTLQVIRIMDNIWRSYGLDMRMLPYDCLCTGQMIGMIQVVAHSKTVMGIQREGGWRAAHQVDNSKLLKWLKEKNPENLDAAVDNFTRSCAGYCVATFVLGIGDRNPDNIMVNEHGQLFHIDFGHFLGHFKSKLGVKRERVPFVLTRDFVHVITKGAANPLKTADYRNFQAMCYRAYLALYDNSHLLIRLFMQMMDSGMPELQSLDDIDYLRASLHIDLSRRNALQFFAGALDAAQARAWSTKVDWFFHSIKHA